MSAVVLLSGALLSVGVGLVVAGLVAAAAALWGARALVEGRR